MSLTVAQKTKLKEYLTTNSNNYPRPNITGMNAAALETAINVHPVAPNNLKARFNSVDGSRFRAELMSVDGWANHAAKADVYELIPQGPMLIDDTVVDALNEIVGIGGAASAAFVAKIDPFIHDTNASYVEHLFDNADFFAHEFDIADALAP